MHDEIYVLCFNHFLIYKKTHNFLADEINHHFHLSGKITVTHALANVKSIKFAKNACRFSVREHSTVLYIWSASGRSLI